MILLHIIDDFHLQGILANMKQKNWWLKQKGYKDMYEHDYITALTIHSFGGEDAFIKILSLDIKKRKICKENGVKLFYYANEKHNFPYKVFMKKDKLLEEIKRD